MCRYRYTLRSVPGASCRRAATEDATTLREDTAVVYLAHCRRCLRLVRRHRDRRLQVWRKDIHLRRGGCRGRAELRQLGKSWHRAARSYLGQYPGDLVGLATLLGHSSLDTTRLSSQPSTRQLASSVEHLSLNASS